MSFQQNECKVLEHDFLAYSMNTIDSRYAKETVIHISKSIRCWWNVISIFNQRFNDLKRTITVNEESSKFEFAYAILQMHSLETIRITECATISVVIGYYGSAFILLRIAIERMLNALYFTIDPSSLDDWSSGKLKLSITGKNGIISRLNNEEFLRKKTGLRSIDREAILGDKLSRFLKAIYRTYSKAVHGVVLESSDFLKPYISSKGDPKQFAKLLGKIEEEYIELFGETVDGVLDILGLIYLISAAFISKGKILEEEYCNKTLQKVLSVFPEMNDFVSRSCQGAKKQAPPHSSNHKKGVRGLH